MCEPSVPDVPDGPYLYLPSDKPPQCVVRESIQSLERKHFEGDRVPLEKLMIAFEGVQSLAPEHRNAFERIGGLHGQPFVIRSGDDSYWGGWCNHRNVLFPTWHRAYILYLEKAMQVYVPDIGLPYLDEGSIEIRRDGLPSCLTDDTFTFRELRSDTIKNPLKSYTLKKDLPDPDPNDDDTFHKKTGYETVRYPFSGLDNAAQQNSRFTSQEGTKLLNIQVAQWMNSTPISGPFSAGDGIQTAFENCLDAANYTSFSNTASSDDYNDDDKKKHPFVVSLEEPHNDTHLAIGGNAASLDPPATSPGHVDGANGDMGDNDFAGFDPVFYFHHCFIDRMFWIWQERHNSVDSISIEKGRDGTISSTSLMFNPPAGIQNDTPLTVETPLYPFQKKYSQNDDDANNFWTSAMVTDISKLGYSYGPGTFDTLVDPSIPVTSPGWTGKKLCIYDMERSSFNGSFHLAAFATYPDGTSDFLGHRSEFSRFNLAGCANCQKHPKVKSFYRLTKKASDWHDKHGSLNVRLWAHGRTGSNSHHTMNFLSHKTYKSKFIS